jgi:hypothetical protein
MANSLRTPSIYLLCVVLTAFWLDCGEGQRHFPARNRAAKQPPVGCLKNEFTCNDKKCIPLSAVCNGTAECADGHDEGAEHCTVIKTGVCTIPRRTKPFCNDSFNANEGQNTAHQFLCQSEMHRNNESLSLTCSNGVWTPTTTLCTRVCQPIVLPTANFTCLRNGKKVNCSQPLLTGTKIYPQCEFYYRPSQREIVCQGNGKWSHNSIECIPECGRQFKEKMRYTRSMRSTEFREFPWSVSIYYTKPKVAAPILIPGTIISPYLVITTAINFYPDHRRGMLDTDSIAVVVAKRTKDAEATDDLFQKTYKVRNIYFTETGYQNYDLSLTSENLAIIELSEKIVLSPSVYPACVNWGKNSTLNAEEATIGQVPHTLSILEANASATQTHEILQTIAIRFFSHDECAKMDAIKNMPYVLKVDNFCTETISAPAPCDGSFIFLEPTTNLFYVQGLVDSVTPSTDVPPTFTNIFIDLAAHMDWINAIRKRNEDRLVVNEVRIQADSVAPAAICKANITSRDTSSVGLRSGFGDENGQASAMKRRLERSSVFCKLHNPEIRSRFLQRWSMIICNDKNTAAGCQLPAKTSMNAVNYTISCALNAPESECRRVKDNATVPEYTSLKLNCRNGYELDTNEEIVCFKSKWNPRITPCRKICDKLPKLENGNITCYEEEKSVSCSAKLKAGVKAVLECDPAYRFEREAAASREIKCKDDGTWSASPSKCIKKNKQSPRLTKIDT